MKKLIIVLLAVLLTVFSQAQDIVVGQRSTFSSSILDEDRSISVYLPPSYHFTSTEKFPVLYILDGDYNFQYVSGLIELWGGISEDIPEMIIVAISGKGTKTYRKNCKPNLASSDDSGNADEVVKFIEKELIPFVNTNYRTNGYKILAGHSVGGLFVTYASMIKPHLFNHYIAISAALWWSDDAIFSMFNQKFRDIDYSANIYFSLANEKGMMVKKFVKMAKKKNEKVQFKQFSNENHNSVGNKTYAWALFDIFKAWKVPNGYFKSNKEAVEYFEYQQSKFGTIFHFPAGAIGYTHYILKTKNEKLEAVKQTILKNSVSGANELRNQMILQYIEEDNLGKANNMIDEVLKNDSTNFKTLENLSKLYYAKQEKEKAHLYIDQAIDFAKKQHARQWMINELEEAKIFFK